MTLIATRYRILEQIPSNGRTRHAVAEKPIRVATLINRAEFERTGAMVHHRTVFFEDQIHDWEWRDGQFSYYSRVADKADVVLVFEARREAVEEQRAQRVDGDN